MAEAANATLRNHIFGQDESINTIVNSLQTWEYMQQSPSNQKSLLLAFSGDVGIGKTETAYQLGSALFDTLPGSSNPCGLLTIMGGDYSENSMHAVKGGLPEVQKQILYHIEKHLIETAITTSEASQHDAIIVFDEIQKIMPGALDILNEAFGPRGHIPITRMQPLHTPTASPTMFSTITHGIGVDRILETFTGSTTDNNQICTNPHDPTTCSARESKDQVPVTRRYPTNRIIFILISDVGTDVMTHLLVSHRDRENIPTATLRNQVKVTLDETLWNRLKIAQNINEVVPFLPLEPRHVRQILQAKIGQLNIEQQGKHWLQLAVDDNVVHYLTTGGFIVYRRIVGKSNPTQSSEANMFSETSSNGKTADKESAPSTTNTKADTTEVVKYFAKFGARSVIFGGPYEDLTGMLNRKLAKSPEKIVHVGLLTEENRVLAQKAWGYTSKQKTPTTEVYFQLCHADPTMLQYDIAADKGGCSMTNPTCQGKSLWLQLSKYGYYLDVQEYHAFSSLCETIWIGKLS